MKKRKQTVCAYCGQPSRTLAESGIKKKKIRRYVCIDEACWFKFYEEADALS